MSYHRLSLVLILWCASVAPAQRGGPASLPATTQPMSRGELGQLYQRELGDVYKAEDLPRLVQAHQLIERYFAQSEIRPSALAAIERLGLDANVLGKLTRLRMYWPALTPGVYYINEKLGPSDVRYFLGLPAGYNRLQSWPLVIKLPTADAFIGDPMPDPVQATQIYIDWMNAELTAHPKAVVIMPLLNLDVLWGPSYQGMDNVILPMQHATSRVNIDPARVHMLGHSMSAHATWNLALHYPTYFASFAALAGGAGGDWQRLRMMNLRNTLPVIWHDADDPTIPIESARQLRSIAQTQRLTLDYTETRQVGHIPTPQIAEQAYSKMTARTRELYPKQVTIQSNRPDTMFNRADWVQMYQPLNPGPDRRMIVTRGGSMIRMSEAAWSIDATINNNTITVNSRNVVSMRFYVNDKMVDFKRAVAVVVNRRPRYEAIMTPSVGEMLKDQLFLGRGWRYYTGVIDIEFGADGTPTTRGN